MNYLITNLKEEIYLIEIFFALYPYQKLLFIIIYLFLPSFAFHYEFENLNYLYHFLISQIFEVFFYYARFREAIIRSSFNSSRSLNKIFIKIFICISWDCLFELTWLQSFFTILLELINFFYLLHLR